MKPLGAILWITLAIVIAVMVTARFSSAGVAPKPPMFASGLTLAEAARRSDESGRPIFTLVTADWCAPCQALKRGPLVDPAVETAVSGAAIPLYIDADLQSPDVKRLNVFSLPTTLVLIRGREVGRIEGFVPTETYRDFVTNALTLATSAQPFPERVHELPAQPIWESVNPALPPR